MCSANCTRSTAHLSATNLLFVRPPEFGLRARAEGESWLRESGASATSVENLGRESTERSLASTFSSPLPPGLAVVLRTFHAVAKPSASGSDDETPSLPPSRESSHSKVCRNLPQPERRSRTTWPGERLIFGRRVRAPVHTEAEGYSAKILSAFAFMRNNRETDTDNRTRRRKSRLCLRSMRGSRFPVGNVHRFHKPGIKLSSDGRTDNVLGEHDVTERCLHANIPLASYSRRVLY